MRRWERMSVSWFRWLRFVVLVRWVVRRVFEISVRSSEQAARKRYVSCYFFNKIGD